MVWGTVPEVEHQLKGCCSDLSDKSYVTKVERGEQKREDGFEAHLDVRSATIRCEE